MGLSAKKNSRLLRTFALERFLMTHHPPRLLRVVGMPLDLLGSLCIGWRALGEYCRRSRGHRCFGITPRMRRLLRLSQRRSAASSPCGMCTKISEERQKEERAPAAAKFDKKAEVFLVEMCDALKRPESEDYSYLSPGESALIERCEAPPAPVPIFA